MGVVDEKETIPLECFDIACLDPISLDASIAACKRFWKMQAKPSLSKKERMQQEVDKLYGRDTHQDDADSAQNGEGENGYITHVAVLLAHPGAYPRDLLSRLRTAGFHHVVYRPSLENQSWETAQWRML